MKSKALNLILIVVMFVSSLAWVDSTASGQTTRWTVELIDAQDQVGWWNAIATDASGNPHIVYQRTDPYGKLKYAYYDGKTWHVEEVDDRGSTADIAVDQNGNPHISYYDDLYNSLKYAYRDDLGWHTQLIDQDPQDAGAYTSIALDSFGHPHISYQGHRYVAPHNLKYAYYDGSHWNIQVVDSSAFVGNTTSIDIDSADHPHIVYFDYYSQSLKYAQFDGNVWQFSLSNALALTSSMELDNADQPHVSFAVGQELRYDFFDGSLWHSQTVDQGHSFGDKSLALDPQGYPHIAYFDRTEGTLKYASYDGSSWSIEIVNVGCVEIPNSDCSISLSIDVQGMPQISFNDAVNRTLRYARYANNSPLVDAGGPYFVDEGGYITVSAIGNDPDGDQLEFAWDLNGDGEFEIPGQNVLFDASWLDGPSTQTIFVKACDQDMACASNEALVEIGNVAPIVNAGSDVVIFSGDVFILEAPFTDPGKLDVHSATIGYGMGNGPIPVSVLQAVGGGTIIGTQQYFVPGSYTIDVCAQDDDLATGCDSLIITINPLMVMIDIKPGSFPNPINPKSNGKIPVAILTTDTFNALDVIPGTVHFGLAGTEAIPTHYSIEDVDGDNDLDLLLHFNTQDSGIVCGTIQAVITGTTLDGRVITGYDSIITPDCKELSAGR
jgi:hypothetical protein